MTAETENLILEILKRIQADLSDLKDRMAGVEVQLSAMGQQIGALTTAVYGGKTEMDHLRRRVERIERRLDLRDTPEH